MSYLESEPTYDDSVMTYLVYAKRFCPAKRCSHRKGYVEFKNQRSTHAALIALGCPGQCITRRAKGESAQQAADSCKMRGDYYKEYGNIYKQGKRNDLDCVTDLVTSTRPDVGREHSDVERVTDLETNTQPDSCEPTAGTRSAEGVVWLDAGQNARLSEIIATSFERHGFVHPRDATKRWSGINGVIKPLGGGATHAFEMQGAASEFMLCVYRNCGIDRNHTPRVVKPTFDPNTVLHSPENSAGKINYQIVLTDVREPWITQNCFMCGGEHGHKMQFICPVVIPPGMCLRSHVMIPPGSAAAAAADPDPDARARMIAQYKKEWARYYIPKVTIIVDGKPVRVTSRDGNET